MFRFASYLRLRFPKAGHFLRDEDGTTAIEFAFVALPLIAILVAIFETCSLFVAQEVLQTSTSKAARLIETGQAQLGSMTATDFKQALCTQASVLFSCSKLSVNVRKFSSFSGVNWSLPITNGAIDSSKLGYSAGAPGDIILVQAFYDWPVLLGPLSFSLSNMKDGGHLIVAAAAFRNEPYQ